MKRGLRHLLNLPTWPPRQQQPQKQQRGRQYLLLQPKPQPSPVQSPPALNRGSSSSSAAAVALFLWGLAIGHLTGFWFGSSASSGSSSCTRLQLPLPLLDQTQQQHHQQQPTTAATSLSEAFPYRQWWMQSLLGKSPSQRHHNSPPPPSSKATETTTTVDNDGWKSIDVFVGSSSSSTQHHSDKNHHNLHNYLNIDPHQRWFAQARQDELIVRLLEGGPTTKTTKTFGRDLQEPASPSAQQQQQYYFIDLAANDAVHWSNTLALERLSDDVNSYYHQHNQTTATTTNTTLHPPLQNWQGLCIEPNVQYWKNLTYRKCQIVAAVVGAVRDDHVYFRYDAGTHGGIAGTGFDNGKRWQRHSTPHQATVTLYEILRRYHVPPVVEYLSLDVEGAESFILMANVRVFQEYQFKLITAERLRGPVRQFLTNHSYEFVQRLTRWGESLWVHRDYKDQMNWSAMEDFGFPLF